MNFDLNEPFFGRYKLFTSLILALFIVACDPGGTEIVTGDPTTCEGCHTSEATLKLYAEESGNEPTGGG